MKIIIEESVKVKKEIEVNFPIYRKLILDNSVIYMKVNNTATEVSVHVDDDESTVELKIEKPSFFGSEDYLLGTGEHKSSESEFLNALKSLHDLIARVS